MQPLTQVQLGDLIFSATGVPEKIPGGGTQMRAVHQLVDGTRIVDSMGPYDQDLAWQGLLFNDAATGVVAADQAQYLDYLRKQGNPVALSWDVYQYTVLVSEFVWDFERRFQISYSIKCTVVADLTAPAGPPPQPTVDDLMTGDMTNSLTAAQNLDMSVPPNLPGPFSTTQGAASSVPVAITWSAPAS
jgi:hypothetical protein